MNEGLLESREEYLLNNFERAINEGWIEIYSQPVIRASNGKVCEEELFARWDDPVLGILNPNDFIPVLENSGLIERLDLYILERAIENIKEQTGIGVNIATTSINISLLSFQNKNFVKEIEDRVCASGISRGKLAFELSENTALIDNHETAVQLAKLKKLGYKLEIDDFGYNCVPFLLAPAIHFDALKLNKELIRHLPTSQEAKTIVEGLLKMVLKLGMDVVAKGVERQEQVDFLTEIGCAKLQGFYYSRPVSAKDLYNFVKSNKQFLTVEDPKEESYYAKVDKVNIHDLSNLRANVKEKDSEDAIAILEVSNATDEIRIIRINDVCERFISESFPGKEDFLNASLNPNPGSPGYYVLSTIKKCIHSDERFIIEDRTPTGKMVHLMIQKVAENPVTGCVAVAFVVVSISDSLKSLTSLSYNYIARALSDEYVAMYIVDIETNNYVEYHTDETDSDVTLERTGDDFFYDANLDVENITYYEDKKMFNELCTKDNILKQIDEAGLFSITYRAQDKMGVRYVNFKAVRDKSNENCIIIGVNSVDKQMKMQMAFKSLQEEKTLFSRIATLSGDYYAIYTIKLDDNSYSVYKTDKGENYIGKNESGDDFFAEIYLRIKDVIHPDDLKDFKKNIKKDVIQKRIAEDGFFEYQYRLIVDGKPTYFKQKAVIITENDEQKLIIGIINTDAQVKKDKEYLENLSVAENMALKDELTGVNNKHAYAVAEQALEDSFKSGEDQKFAIAVFDLNDLKYVNDNFGHKKGDEYIEVGCKLICDTFANSPVYRIGGDEFVVIAQGKDYNDLDFLMEVIEKKNNDNKLTGDVTVAGGIARGTNNSVISEVFAQADSNMYEKKKKMKAERFS